MNLDQDEYQVQKILDKKVFNGKTLYLVKWKHFPTSQATWECNKILLSAKDKIKEFKYTKKGSENLPDIKFQEDLPSSDTRDAFKRKRGRPPKIHLNSIRSVVSNHQTLEVQNSSNHSLMKRGKGRPRGSKNKKSYVQRDSEQSSFNSKEEQTLSNSDEKGIQNGLLDVSSDSSLKMGKKSQKKAKMAQKLSSLNSSYEVEEEIVETSQESRQSKKMSADKKSKGEIDSSKGSGLLEVKSLNLQRVEENKVLGERDLDYLRVFLKETSEKIRVLQKMFGCENDKVCEDRRIQLSVEATSELNLEQLQKKRGEEKDRRRDQSRGKKKKNTTERQPDVAQQDG